MLWFADYQLCRWQPDSILSRTGIDPKWSHELRKDVLKLSNLSNLILFISAVLSLVLSSTIIPLTTSLNELTPNDLHWVVEASSTSKNSYSKSHYFIQKWNIFFEMSVFLNTLNTFHIQHWSNILIFSIVSFSTV